MKAIFAVIALTLSLFGCAASGPKFTHQAITPESPSVLYLYRTYSFIGAAGSPYVYLDGVNKGKLNSGGYVKLTLSSGEHEIIVGKLEKDSPNWAPENASFKIRETQGEEFFIKMLIGQKAPAIAPVGSTVLFGYQPANISLIQVESSTALKELQETNESH